MDRLLFYFTFIVTLIIISACNSQDSTLKPILTSFEEEGIALAEVEETSKLFNVSGSDLKQYEFDGGTIYFIYNYEDKNQIIEELRGVFAEAEFPYPVISLYKDEFCIIFVSNSDHAEMNQKIDSIFQNNLKDL